MEGSVPSCWQAGDAVALDDTSGYSSWVFNRVPSTIPGVTSSGAPHPDDKEKKKEKKKERREKKGRIKRASSQQDGLL